MLYRLSVCMGRNHSQSNCTWGPHAWCLGSCGQENPEK